MRKLKLFPLAVASVFLASLWGCGSNLDSDSSTTPTVAIGDAARAGNCTVCHTLGVHTQVSTIAGQNTDASGLGSAINHDCEDCHGGGQYHHGTGPIPYPAPGAARCATCHDSANQVIASNKHVDTAGAPACANCHNPLALTTEPYANCVTCHTTTTPAVVTKVTNSMHNFGGGRFSANCQRCHTVEGFVNLIENSINPSANDNYTSVALTLTAGTAPTCAACHDPHTTGLRAVPGWDPNQNAADDQFDLCTACHNLYNNDGSLVSTFYHQTTWYRNIQSTHYDNPTTGVTGSGDTALDADRTIEGYVVRKNSANPCFDCHGHELRANTRRHLEAPQADLTYGPTIQTDWARSAHAGGLLANKTTALADALVINPALTSTEQFAVVAATGTVDAPVGNAWAHYNWDRSGRASCQRCHTATGAANFLVATAAGTPYVAANNDFSHLAGWTPATAGAGSNQNEVLYCWGCHSNAEQGTLRNPGAITESYAAVVNSGTGTTGTVAVVTYPDAGASNVCMGCHLGREVGQNIKNTTDGVGTNTGDLAGMLGFINSHYLTAGATLFNESGYEYANQNYVDPTFFAHNTIGLSTPVAATDRGPCASCHMGTGTASHTFEVVEKDAADVIVGINSDVCVTCHVDAFALTAAGLETEKEEYHAALVVLEAALAAKGIYFFPAHPYFYKDPNGDGFTPNEAVSANAFTNWGLPYGPANWKDTMGAAFNYNLLEHDPGGYAHNRYYAKRLIFDAIDFIDNGVLDGTITVADADAAAYLDGDGVTAGVQRP